MSYIISNHGELIAKTEAHLPSAASVRYGQERSREEIDANREYNLVNAKDGKISNAKRWDAEYRNSEAGMAVELNPGEFLVS